MKPDNSLNFSDNFDKVNINDVGNNTSTENFIGSNTSSPVDNCEQVEDKNCDSVSPKALPKTDNTNVQFKTKAEEVDPDSSFCESLLEPIPRENPVDISSLLSGKSSTTEPADYVIEIPKDNDEANEKVISFKSLQPSSFLSTTDNISGNLKPTNASKYSDLLDDVNISGEQRSPIHLAVRQSAPEAASSLSRIPRKVNAPLFLLMRDLLQIMKFTRKI